MVTSDALKTFGAAVRKARVDAGWTLSELAHQAFGNSDRKGFVSQIELGKRQITPLTAGKLAEALALKDDVLDLILKNDPPADDAPTPEDTRAAQLLTETEKEGDPGIGETLLIALAYEYADTNTADLRLAYNDLKAALEAARNMKARAALPDNTGDGVAAVRAEVQRLNEEDGPEAGGAFLDDAIARKTAEMGALLDLGIDQDRVRNDPKAAAAKLVMQLRMDATPDRIFDALRDLQDDWYVRGRDGGLNFDASVAISLAEASCDLARGADQSGTALNVLGIALGTLGERETDTARLEQAVAAHTDALQEWTRDRVPMNWAAAKNNLGSALQHLGERENSTTRLEQAVAAYTDALKEWTREKVPRQWAGVYSNLSTALQSLGERELNTTRLEHAVAAYAAVLQEWTREEVPMDWAATQHNLGSALKSLGQLETDSARLKQAVVAYTNALQERTREKVPLDWAATQNNLGNALFSLAAYENGTVQLKQAVHALTNALEERRREKVPLDWATTQHNLGHVEIAFFDMTNGAAHLDRAQSHADAARKVYEAAGADYFIRLVDDQLSKIAQRRLEVASA